MNNCKGKYISDPYLAKGNLKLENGIGMMAQYILKPIKVLRKRQYTKQCAGDLQDFVMIKMCGTLLKSLNFYANFLNYLQTVIFKTQ